MPFRCVHDGVNVEMLAPVFELEPHSATSPANLRRVRYNNDDRAPMYVRIAPPVLFLPDLRAGWAQGVQLVARGWQLRRFAPAAPGLT